MKLIQITKLYSERRVDSEDIIRMKSDITLTDKGGNEIEVKSLEPEYRIDSIL